MDKSNHKESEHTLNKGAANENYSEGKTINTLHPPSFQLKANGNQLKNSDKEHLAKGWTSHNESHEFANSSLPPYNASDTYSNFSNEPQTQSPFQLKNNQNSTGLPNQLKSGIENLSGYSLDDVNVHFNSEKPAQLNANAYAQGSDIHLGQGQEKHLPHEAWHVVQQKQGKVKPTVNLNGGIPVNDDESLENEADAMGAKALQLKPISNTSNSSGFTSAPIKQFSLSNTGIVQMSAQENIVKVGNKLGVSKNIQAIANHFETSTQKAHSILSANDTLDVIIANLQNQKDKVLAEKMESDDYAGTGGSGGHAIARHGPDIGSDLLIRRLHTGLAPDDALVPAPGSSSQFVSYTAMLETRQAVSQKLKSEIVAAQGKILRWVQKAINESGLENIHVKSQESEQSKKDKLDKAEQSKTEGFALKGKKALSGEQKKARLDKYMSAKSSYETAKSRTATADAEKQKPGLNLARLLPSQTNLALNISPDDVAPGNLENSVRLPESHSVTIKHNKPIGKGYKSDDSIKLSDVLDGVAIDSSLDDPQPKSVGEIKAALSALGFAGSEDEFVAYLSKPANLALIKRKTGKNPKIYKAEQDAGDLHKSFTKVKNPGSLDLFTSNLGSQTDTPKNIDTSNWPAIQHFPAPEDAEEKIE